MYLTNLGLDGRGFESYAYYNIINVKSSDFIISLNVACKHEGMCDEIYVDNNLLTKIPCEVDEYNLDKTYLLRSERVELPKGNFEFKLYIRGSREGDCINVGKIEFERQ